MFARKDIFAKPSRTQLRRGARGRSPKACKARISQRIFYHEAKMFARKDIFAKPSRTQLRRGARGRSPKACKARFSAYIITYNKSKGNNLQ